MMNRVYYSTSAASKPLVQQLINSNVDYQFIARSSLNSYYFQKSLPRLPVPKLELSAERYLNSVKNIISASEFNLTQELVRDFVVKDGTVLQAELVQIDKSLKNTNYISSSWFEMYLKDRVPLPINYNPAIVLAEDEEIEKMDLNRRQVVRATNLLVSSLRFMKSLDAQILGPEVYHMNPTKSDTDYYRTVMKMCPSLIATYASYLFKAYPLDMSQYDNLFRSTRIPGISIDKIVKSKRGVRHIVIMRNGHFFSAPVLDDKGDILPVNELLGQIEYILSLNLSPETSPIGLLTSQNRDIWAELRSHLTSISLTNEKNLELIDSALFVLCLDDKNLGKEPGIISKEFLHSDGVNRWFDKSYQLIVSGDGWAGLNFEHAWGDGVAVLRYLNDIHSDSIKFKWANESRTGKISSSTPPTQLRFEIDDKLKEGIEKARERLMTHSSSLHIDPFIFEKFGKSECKKWKVSPDSVMQLGFQIAYYRLFGDTPATYESCSTAAFKHGRTETIRPATSFTKEVSEILGKKDWEAHISTLKDLITKCSEKHNQLTKEAAMGQGFDRHLYFLKLLSEKKNKVPQIFTDSSYIKLNKNILSTSTLSSNAVRIGAFGPVVPNGFGLGYQIWDGGLGTIISTYSGKRNGTDFKNAAEGAFSDLKKILDTK